MPDPFVMRDMEAATDRLKRAVERGERVAIFGDYDVDGACSAALLSEYLVACGCETIVHIPDRVTEGYGPNVEAITSFAAQGREARRHGRLRRGQPRALRACAPPRPRRDRVRSPSGAGDAAAGARARRSQPAGRSLRPRLSLRRGRRLHGAASRSTARCARAASSAAGSRRISSPRSISSRSRRSPTSCR